MSNGPEIPLAVAQSIATELAQKIKAKRVIIAGSIRRRENKVRDIDIVVETSNLSESVGEFGIESGGDRRAIFHYKGISINAYKSLKEELGAMLMFLTGPAMYNIGYRARAKSMGLKLNQYGLWKESVRIAGWTEESIYRMLGKEYRKPEERGK
jgi:DNA polymerase (family 10)